MTRFRKAVHALLAGSIGALLGACVYAGAEYLLFVEQIVRMVGTMSVWVGPPRIWAESPLAAELVTGTGLARLGIFTAALQGAAWRSS